MLENLSKILTVVTTLLLSISIYGQTESSSGIDSTQLAWNLVIALIVIVFTAASAALPVAAARQWQSSWSVAAKIPLVLLAEMAIPVPDPHTNIPISLFFFETLLDTFFA